MGQPHATHPEDIRDSTFATGSLCLLYRPKLVDAGIQPV
jgi:hypothetical protein